MSLFLIYGSQKEKNKIKWIKGGTGSLNPQEVNSVRGGGVASMQKDMKVVAHLFVCPKRKTPIKIRTPTPDVQNTGSLLAYLAPASYVLGVLEICA